MNHELDLRGPGVDEEESSEDEEEFNCLDDSEWGSCGHGREW